MMEMCNSIKFPFAHCKPLSLSLSLSNSSPPGKNMAAEFAKVIVVFCRDIVSKFLLTHLPSSHCRSNRQVPGYLESQDALKEAGIEEIIVYCVNDGAVMKVSEQTTFLYVLFS
jgi:hypothetical protein